MTDRLYIPMDDAIDEFRKHLLSHPRTILSAQYGDGKSFFLQEFERNKAVRKQFVFLTLFPVNYQVVENKDIFELIKYDLLFQLFTNHMIEPTEALSDSLSVQWFLMTHGKDITAFISEICRLIGAENKEAAAVATALDTLPKILKIKEKWETFKEKHGEPNSEVGAFLRTIDEHYLYEVDPISSFIKEAIQTYKKKHRKKIVLIIEDMDRLDPAHLFRILNVLSAHIDYAYRYGLSPNRESVAGNKFGVDNVVLVLDYENTKKIYSHFYGEKTSFDGYINKFISNGYFEYSLTHERNKYFLNQLTQETHVQEQLIEKLIDGDYYEGKTIREIANAIQKTEEQLFNIPQYVDINRKVDLPRGILQLMVVMRRLGMSDSEIISCCENAIIEAPEAMFVYLGGFWLVYKNHFPSEYVYVKSQRDNYSYVIKIDDIREDNGLSIINKTESPYYENEDPHNMQDFLRYVLGFVAR